MTGQAPRCGSVGSANRFENQRAMAGWKRDSGILAESLGQGGAAQGDDPFDRLADLVVRRGGSRGNADRQASVGQPPFAPRFIGMRPDRAIADAAVVDIDAGGVL